MLEVGTLLSLEPGRQPTGNINPSAARLVPWTKSRRVICRSIPSSRSVFFIYFGTRVCLRSLEFCCATNMLDPGREVQAE